ncbi:hypothetical protein ABPG72_008547 [Tetrahymena utriculariae]
MFLRNKYQINNLENPILKNSIQSHLYFKNLNKLDNQHDQPDFQQLGDNQFQETINKLSDTEIGKPDQSTNLKFMVEGETETYQLGDNLNQREGFIFEEIQGHDKLLTQSKSKNCQVNNSQQQKEINIPDRQFNINNTEAINPEKKINLKVMVLGEANVGKTQIKDRQILNQFNPTQFLLLEQTLFKY